MGKSSPPKPPNPREQSAAQTGTNVGTAIANQMMGMVNQQTPYGSLSYDQTGEYEYRDPYTRQKYDIPTFTANTRLNEDGQYLQGQQIQTQKNLGRLATTQSGRLNDLLGQRFNLDDLPQGGDLNESLFRNNGLEERGQFDRDFSKDRQRVENALMQRMRSGLDQDREALETRLANQGIGIGTEAYDRAMANSNQQRNDARMSAILNAGQEQSRLAGLDLAGAQYQDSHRAADLSEQQAFANMDLTKNNYLDSQRQRAMQQAFAERNQPLNEIAALMSGSQVQNPQFQNVPTAQIPTTDNAAIIGTNYNQRLNNWQEQQAQAGSMLTGLGGMFGSALSGGLIDVASPLMTIGRR